jgi:flagellar biosynthesis/type III secretory pathway protein FliH
METGRRILKASGPLARRIDGAVWDADRRVREAAAAAEERARALVADAEAERDRIRDEAREAGRSEGVARAAAALLRAAEERDRILRGAAREVARLAVAVAGKVLGRELADGPALPLAEVALAAARARREVILRVNPADAAAVLASGGRLAAALGRPGVEVCEDLSVPPGGAVVETEAGRIDAGIEAQLEVLARALEEAIP